MELHELRQGVLKELEATAAAERAPEVCTWGPVSCTSFARVLC